MPKVDAVSAVTGDLFDEGWSRVRGSMQGLTGEPKRLQMARAARGHRAAVFKAIRSGGCHTRAELVRQLDYLTTKSSHIVDSRGVLDGKETLTGKEIEAVADRFARRWSDGFHPKLGQTTHMLMSFPIGTKGEDVRDIASEVCERFFSNDERHFDYLIAVHEDRDHPHAHVVLNRKSQEGEFFYLGRDHHFNYDDFRIAMVEAAETVGVRLEATRRVHRGVIDYPPRTREVYAAREEGRAALGRERFGGDLTAAQAAVKSAAKEYARLGASVTDDWLKEPLVRAGELLAQGERLEPTGGVYEPTVEDRRADELKPVLDRFGAATVAERPALQKELASLLLAQADRDPHAPPPAIPGDSLPEQKVEEPQDVPAAGLGQRMRSWIDRVRGVDRSAPKNKVFEPAPQAAPAAERLRLLREEPSEDGVYSVSNIIEERTDRLYDLATRARIETALRGTGVPPETVIARIEAGADNAALEILWRNEDREAIAAHNGFDFARPDHAEHIAASLDRMRVELGEALAEAGILRTDGVVRRDYEMHFDADSLEDRCVEIREGLRKQGLDDSRIAERTDEIEAKAYLQIEAEQKAWFGTRTDFPHTSDAVYRENAEGELVIVDPELADELMETADRMLRLPGAPGDIPGAVSTALRSMYQGRKGETDMPEHLVRGLANTFETVCVLRVGEQAHEAEVQARLQAETAREAQRREAERLAAERSAIAARARAEGYPEICRMVIYEKVDADERMEIKRPGVEPFRREVEAVLGEDGIAALKAGDVDTLDGILPDRLDRLNATKVYLKSDPEHAVANGEALDRVVSEILDIESENRKLATGEVERRGLTH
ncbi:relaxase/mobilization nuclease domain-containing protein [Profundibacterium mesophilum]|uniref:T-DNA border endonuclease virD2 n=1 Tax=Profundibacterium mesophilum KAUST100406-0324 TaxID=1037889 RepID=A0A921NSW4_9RHOB|nr:relaxase/mobilization nuclease domain-containing protein [Profundibacterium mesophilum]KAF0674890.1 T-DNA border endonuclease virD2 [Profundibacterium mesophilum KAUST100406-0324]